MVVLATACFGDDLLTGTGQPRQEVTAHSTRPETATSTVTDGSTSTEDVRRRPVIRAVPHVQWRNMRNTGMVRPGCPITERHELRRVDVDFVDFSGELRRGHLIVNKDIARSVARIFDHLAERRFPIRRMEGAERYGGDVLRNLKADNTSAFNCRRPDQINAPVLNSPHANGRAIDINPRENPWKDTRCSCWSPGRAQAAREPGPGKILQGGLVWRRFRQEGWVWQNISVADYMHFDTGYPSRPVNDATVPITGAGNR